MEERRGTRGGMNTDGRGGHKYTINNTSMSIIIIIGGWQRNTKKSAISVTHIVLCIEL